MTAISHKPAGPAKNAAPNAALALADYERGVIASDRAVLARAITLIESRKREHRGLAQQLLQRLLPRTGAAYRIGITGAPGVGKSTMIDQFGSNLIAGGHKVAVLAVDPSSSRTGGSILGDKTRMARLAANPDAFIRPSPSGGTLGGVTRTTRETQVLCEAAGFDIIIVETVGIGQSEIAVSNMVDFFLVLMLPGAGDELQGLKKGVLEIADMIAVNKADGDNEVRATATMADYRAALHILTAPSPNWRPPVIAISSLKNKGLDSVWENIAGHREKLTASGEFAARRRAQAVQWMHDLIAERIRAAIKTNTKAALRLRELEREVREGRLMPAIAAAEIAAELGLGL